MPRSTPEPKVVIVTGAASGIGAATALVFGLRGYHVVAADLDAQPGIVDTIRSRGGSAEGVAGDVGDPVSWDAFTTAARARTGRIDALVQAAGAFQWGSILDDTPETWDRMLRVNLTGAWLGMRAVLPTMVAQRGGSIVNVASAVALIGVAGQAAYTASKGGLVALTRQVAQEYAADGLQVNAIAPGIVDTPMWHASRPDPAATEAAIASTPVQRMGTPTEVAELAFYLSSPAASYIIGQAISIDGGATIGPAAPPREP